MATPAPMLQATTCTEPRPSSATTLATSSLKSRSPRVASTGSVSESPKPRRSTANTLQCSGVASIASCQNSDEDTFPWMKTTAGPPAVGSPALEHVRPQPRRLNAPGGDAVDQCHRALRTSVSGGAQRPGRTPWACPALLAAPALVVSVPVTRAVGEGCAHIGRSCRECWFQRPQGPRHGGASGIGAACARAFAERGATVVVADLDGEAAAAVAQRHRRRGVAGGPVQHRRARRAGARRGHPGEQRRHPARQPDPGVRPGRVPPHPRPHGRGAVPPRSAPRCPACTNAGFGRIINISSVHGLRASEFKSAYVAAKHGLEGLSKIDRAGGRPARGHQQLHQPRLRAHPARREADRRPGAAARHPRVRGGREGHAGRDRDQAARSSRPRSRPAALARRRRRRRW